MEFSQKNRAFLIENLKATEFDLLIIGGGITGCGIALDASLKGLKVALLEKNDFASGTSSRSTKLIHGGLRYLKQFEFKLVHDVGTERAIVHENARHLVIAEKMLLPIVKNGTLGKFATSIGLWVYDLLAGVKFSERRKMLSAKETLFAEPLLDKEKIIGGGLYFEYRTDDSRLVIEIAKSAHKESATLLNYMCVETLLYNDLHKVNGVLCTDIITHEKLEIKAKKIVNATGPFVDLIRQKDNSLFGKRLQLTKGIHLVFDYAKFPIKQAVYFDVGDGRMIFAIPRNKITYVGTTDTIYAENIDNPVVLPEDKIYLLNAIQQLFPTINLSERDIISSWAGLRPLIYEEGKTASELSRKDEIMESESGLISIAGGKLTGYRLMAEKIVDKVMQELTFTSVKEASTKNYKLSGGDFESEEDLQITLDELQRNHPHIKQEIENWFYKYGSNTIELIRNFEETEDALLAEWNYCVAHEMVHLQDDFLTRRTAAVHFDKLLEEKVKTAKLGEILIEN